MTLTMNYKKESSTLKKTKTLAPISNDRMDNFDYVSADDINILKEKVVK